MKFLVFQHVPHEPPGLIAKFAKERIISLDVIEMWNPFTIPDSSNYDALIIMGGPMGVYEGKDVFPSKDNEVNFIQENIDKLPMLGFCLGSQLLAYALGANIYPNNKDGKLVKEIGYYDIDLTEEGKNSPIFKGFKPTFPALEWHGDTFDIPNGAVKLASSPLCSNQAFSYKKAFGMLYHCEITPDMLKKLIEVDNEYIHDNFTVDEAFLQKQSEEYAVRMEDQSRMLFTNFLEIVEH